MDNKENREQPRAPGNVTRLEFYIGIALVLLSVLSLAVLVNNTAERRLWDAVVRLEHRATETELTMSRLAGETMDYVYNVAEEMEQRREYILISHSMQVIGVNQKAGTMRLALSAYPKEYSDGMEGTFYVCRDSIEEFEVPGVFDENGVLRAEAELPMCRWVYANVSLRTGSSEKRQTLGEMEITESMTMPEFAGRWKEFSHDMEDGEDTLMGTMEVEADFPYKEAALQDCMLEIQKDGKTVQTVPMERATIDPEAIPRQNPKYYGRIQEPILLEEGCDIAFFFKAEDGDGAQYTYLVQKGTLDAKTGRYVINHDGLEGESLTIE